MKRGFKAEAGRKSKRLRNELGLKEHEPLCAFDLAKHIGVKVFTPNSLIQFGLKTDHVSTLLGGSSSNWSAAVIPMHSEESHLIIHNPKHSPARQQSNIMHEIAHIVCGHEPEVLDESLGMLAHIMRSYNKEHEEEAEYLGACLQLPRPALLWSMKKTNVTRTDCSPL